MMMSRTAPRNRGKPISAVPYLAISYILSFRGGGAAVGLRHNDQTAVSLGINGAYAKNHIIFGFLQVDLGFAGSNRVFGRKAGIVGQPPQNLVGLSSRNSVPH